MAASVPRSDGRSGPLHGVRVIELASEHIAFAGKLMADLGADVIVVEPIGGHRSRAFGPFVGSEPDPEQSLWWWHYNTSKRGVTLDLDQPSGRESFRRLCERADVVLEATQLGKLGGLGIDYDDVRGALPRLVWVSVTPFGRSGPRAQDPATDLTLLASGGAVWSCGYDDHSLPPVRGGGNQAFHMASTFAVLGALTALLHRDRSGDGQRVEVNENAAVNISTELATYEWLIGGLEVQRQTGRHASVQPSLDTTVTAADGKMVNTGVPPRNAAAFRSLSQWLDELGLRDEFPEAFFLDLGAQRAVITSAEIAEDPEVMAIYGAGREALTFIGSRLPAYEFFVGSQERGLPTGIVYSPDEAFADPHIVARGFPTPVEHADGARVSYPGAPYRFSRSPWAISRPSPRVGEHNAEIIGAQP
jgi:crotonobetainyl-CoA:carnitine CoA-transferase CaiB-like acyl-CoA transferase